MLRRSISKRILGYFFIVSATLVVAIFYAFEEAGKDVFKKMEQEKASVIIDTILPSVAMNLYLGFDERINQLIRQVIDANENILGITVVKDNKIVGSFLKKGISAYDYFVMTRDIKQPNSSVVLGRMHVIYSYEHYNRLVEKYLKLLGIFLLGIVVLLILFSLFIEQQLQPLKKIVLKLKHYKVGNEIDFSDIGRSEDEVGAIVTVLENMQSKIKSYSKRQEEMNKILEQKVNEKTKELKERLYIDNLTELPNRLKLQEDLEQLSEASLVILNIDGFKEINDLFGHKIGDKILVNFAHNIKALINTNNPRIYRLSGDEFALLFTRKMSQKDIEQFLELFSRKIENMIFFHGDKELALHVTMGAALEKEGALEKADIALKKAKRLRKVYEIYHEDDRVVEKQYEKNIEWIKRLKRSIELDRVVPFFQPIVNVRTLKPKGYESLVRILDDEGNPISPGEFLEIAKKSRFYLSLTELMIKKSCEYFERSSCSFSINLSILDILNEDIVKSLRGNIERYGVANRIILEIVESEGIDNYELVYDFVGRMKDIGCQIAIDDFGSGYSNFEHLLRLPVDYLKIDGSLVKNVANDINSELIISTIVSLARKKGIKTVAEYVSSKEIYEKIKELDVDYAQGFYFAPPKQFVETQECQ